ncbi:MAG: HU family DNA-binding protein [Holosporaceae bacterium]|jgi:integration host factor subunit alpha|nr:HU family DNA-binding protein [Holosporaceae bacterium]
MKKDGTKTLTRIDLANEIIKEFQVTKFNALDIVEEVLEKITTALAEEGSVKISCFGTFIVRDKKERMGRNPKTLKAAVISSRKSLSFRASSMLKKVINTK